MRAAGFQAPGVRPGPKAGAGHNSPRDARRGRGGSGSEVQLPQPLPGLRARVTAALLLKGAAAARSAPAAPTSARVGGADLPGLEPRSRCKPNISSGLGLRSVQFTALKHEAQPPPWTPQRSGGQGTKEG